MATCHALRATSSAERRTSDDRNRKGGGGKGDLATRREHVGVPPPPDGRRRSEKNPCQRASEGGPEEVVTGPPLPSPATSKGSLQPPAAPPPKKSWRAASLIADEDGCSPTHLPLLHILLHSLSLSIVGNMRKKRRVSLSLSHWFCLSLSLSLSLGVESRKLGGLQSPPIPRSSCRAPYTLLKRLSKKEAGRGGPRDVHQCAYQIRDANYAKRGVGDEKCVERGGGRKQHRHPLPLLVR